MKAALVIGIEHYRYHEPAVFASADAEGIAAALERHCDFSRDGIWILPDRVDAREIRARLTERKGTLRPDDLFVFYFAGHGIFRDDGTFLVGHEAPLDGPSVFEESVSLSWILEAVDAIGAGHSLVICDCCRAGDGRAVTEFAFPSRLPDLMRVLRPLRVERQYAVLLGCSPNERTYGDLDAEHGAFTSILIAAFEHAVSVDGLVTAASVADYTYPRVREWTEAHPHRVMTPQFASSSGQIVLAGGRSATPERRPAAREFRFTNGDGVTDLAAWFEWLLAHPTLCAEQFRDPARVQAWLERWIHPQAAEGRARTLSRHQDGIWAMLADLAGHIGLSSGDLLDRLRQRHAEVHRLLQLSSADADYFANLSRLDRAEALDRFNPRIASLRAVLYERLRLAGRNQRRATMLDEVKDLLDSGDWTRAIALLEVVSAAGPLGSAEVRHVAGMRGTPRAEEIDGEAFVRMPPGLVRLHTGRLVALREFSISRQPVTVGAYQRMMPLPAIAPLANPGWLLPHHSMVFVDWHGAQRYCASRRGLLPSEAQWEYARGAAHAALAWPSLSEWCRDLFQPPRLEPALDPCEDGPDAAAARVVRRPVDARASRPAAESAETLAFRLVIQHADSGV